jgi:CRISPR type III-A-associated RAMP protein Csm5
LTDFLEACEAVIEIHTLTPLLVWTGKTTILGLDSFILQRGGKRLFLVAGEECLEVAVRRVLSGRSTVNLDGLARALPKEVRRLLEADLCGAEIAAEAVATPSEGEAVLVGWKYPPETTVKGLIRTAVLTSILAKELKGRGAEVALRSIQDAVDSISRGVQPKNAARRLEETRFTLQVPPTNFRYDVFQRINVTLEDGEHVGMVLDVFEVRERGGGLTARLNVVAIKPGSTFRYRLVVTRLSRRIPGRVSRGPASVIRNLNELDARVASCEGVIDSLGLYSKLLLESEMTKYKNLDIPGLPESIENLRIRLERMDEGYLPLKLGLKAGHDSKTITPLMKAPQAAGVPRQYNDALGRLYSSLTRSMSRVYRKLWDDLTTTISRSTGMPVGWIAVRITR